VQRETLDPVAATGAAAPVPSEPGPDDLPRRSGAAPATAARGSRPGVAGGTRHASQRVSDRRPDGLRSIT